MIKVGDRFYYVPREPRDYHRANYITISKVSRIYAYSEELGREYKIEIKSLTAIITNYGIQGELYSSKENYEDRLKAIELYRGLISKGLPKDITYEQVLKAYEILGIERDIKND